MNDPSDDTIRHLRQVLEQPDLRATKYRIIDFIARGGMGTVYRVHDTELERDAALKVLSNPTIDEAWRERMIAEARTIARLEHPGIVPVHDVGELPDGRVYYAMKLVSGRDLESYATTNRSQLDLLSVFSKICDAVAFAHAHGVIHRDLKPKNVMVGDFGEVLVLDWGLAKWLEPEAGEAAGEGSGRIDNSSQDGGGTRIGTVMGTPGYMSPEQASAESNLVDHRSDIYALGAILKFLIDTSANASPPKRLLAVAEKAMSEHPTDRYQSVEQLERDAARFLAGEDVTAYEDTALEKLGRLAYRHRVPIGLIVAYLLLRVLLIFFRST